MIDVTPEARARIMEQATKANRQPTLIVDVAPAGCSGLQYKITWATDNKPEWLIYARNPVRIYATPQASTVLEGASLVLKQEGLNTGFDFENPNVKDQCGCGKSFNV